MIQAQTQDEHGEGAGVGPDQAHVPVLAEQVVEVFSAAALTGWIVDGTLGAAGHTSLLLKNLPGVRVLGCDQDPNALALAAARLEAFGERSRQRRARFSQLAEVLDDEGIEELCGALFDLGVSSMQLDEPDRGFSFDRDGPLDMRMDPSRDRTAADIVNSWDESDLADLIYYEGGEGRARRVAREIVAARVRAPFRRTMQLAELIERAVGRRGKTHPATRTFQALRRAVNEEHDELHSALKCAEERLVEGGVLAVISFHSGEDAVVKRYLAEGARAGTWRLVNRRPMQADSSELTKNRRARSARLRAAIRVREGEER